MLFPALTASRYQLRWAGVVARGLKASSGAWVKPPFLLHVNKAIGGEVFMKPHKLVVKFPLAGGQILPIGLWGSVKHYIVAERI